MGAMLTFKISARRFLHDEFASSNGSANGTTDHWVLLLQSERKNDSSRQSDHGPERDRTASCSQDGRNMGWWSNPGRRYARRIGCPNSEAGKTVTHLAPSPAGRLGAPRSAYDGIDRGGHVAGPEDRDACHEVPLLEHVQAS